MQIVDGLIEKVITIIRLKPDDQISVSDRKGSSGRTRTYNPPVNSDAGNSKNVPLFTNGYGLNGRRY
jgi:hypothetical protein